MKTVQQILDGKGSDVWSITPDASVLEAIKLMAEKEVGALLVMTGEKPVGIVSERDYARKVILKGRSQETSIQDIMTTHVVYVSPDQSIEECMALMTEKHIRHLPVMDGERLCGMLSIGDLVKTVIAEQKLVIKELERYISG
ncbi:MAG: CBS domain-containing protein [Gammaproteobacteria bacterium]|jgi:CBS domain-containing protein|nr:CBS domain-containing protein [Pseudomonadota bacterium]MCZ6733480.1 CBS domain-containing protein [Gammaproteobacteria bacterium]